MPMIFISYRRTDAPGHAGPLYDRLVERFGETSVFKDLDSLEPGADFVEVIEETVARCDALVAVIGRDWLTAAEGSHRRLDDPEDWVRLEISNALKREIRVVPVLVAGARMPPAAELPDDLRGLARRNAVELSESAWSSQVRQLLDALERMLRTSSATLRERLEPAVERTQSRDDRPPHATVGHDRAAPWTPWPELGPKPRTRAEPRQDGSKLLLTLVLDTSQSMSGEPIASLNEGLQRLREKLRHDHSLASTASVALITFGHSGVTAWRGKERSLPGTSPF